MHLYESSLVLHAAKPVQLYSSQENCQTEEVAKSLVRCKLNFELERHAQVLYLLGQRFEVDPSHSLWQMVKAWELGHSVDIDINLPLFLFIA